MPNETNEDVKRVDPAVPAKEAPVVVAAYEEADQARIAVKLLVNNGFSATDQLTVLCSDEKRSEAFRSRLMPAGAPQLNTAPSVVGSAGAAIGAGLLGGVGLATGGAAAVAGALVGAVTGAGVGILLGAGTYGDDETKRLMERHAEELERGLIVVRVKLEGDDLLGQSTKAEDLLTLARRGVE